jgi:1-acyl-sn-glycerol-3-phosphate acyltransferase
VGFLRAGLRLLAIILFSAKMYLIVTVGAAAIDLRRRLRRSGTGSAHWRARVFRFWARTMVRLVGLRIDREGAPPEPPFLLVCNHLGYADVIVLASQLHCVFVARADVSDWPLIGALCRSVNTMFIDRDIKRDIPRVMQQIDGILSEGLGVVLFPEGTSTKGEQVQPFRPSLLEAAARAGRAVRYASLSYATPPGSIPAHLSVCWWGEMPFFRHVMGLLALPHIEARLVFGEESIAARDRKVLAERLQHAVQRQFRAVV